MVDSQLPDIPYEHRNVTTNDGVSLAVQEVGTGPPVIIANGIGVTQPGLDMLVDALRPDHRVITWDYRGIYRSPIVGPLPDMSMERHAADGLHILDALDEPRAAVLGWSMGVPVGLNMIDQAPDRIAGYGALFGAAGPPFRAAFPLPIAVAVESMFKLSYYGPQIAQALMSSGAALPAMCWQVCNAIQFVGPLANRALFAADVTRAAANDKKAYFRTMAHLLDHDARPILPHVHCPTLVVAGTRDRVTPPSAAEEMVDRVPQAKLVVLPGTSHFGVIEHGPELWEPIKVLLALAFQEKGDTQSAA